MLQCPLTLRCCSRFGGGGDSRPQRCDPGMETNRGVPCTHSLGHPQLVFTRQVCQSACLHVKTHPWGQQHYSCLADEETEAQTR